MNANNRTCNFIRRYYLCFSFFSITTLLSIRGVCTPKYLTLLQSTPTVVFNTEWQWIQSTAHCSSQHKLWCLTLSNSGFRTSKTFSARLPFYKNHCWINMKNTYLCILIKLIISIWECNCVKGTSNFISQPFHLSVNCKSEFISQVSTGW